MGLEGKLNAYMVGSSSYIVKFICQTKFVRVTKICHRTWNKEKSYGNETRVLCS